MKKTCWLIGASSGIGYELAKKFALNNYDVIISARSLDKLQQLKSEIAALNSPDCGQIFVEKIDVEDYNSVTQCWQNINKVVKDIDLVIFASAIYERMALQDFNLEVAKKIMHVNFDGFLHILNIIFPYFKNQKKGHIAVIASVAGYRGLPQSMTYGAAKSALINLCEGIYPELLTHNINLSIINPGFVKTQLTAKNNFAMPFIIDANAASNRIFLGIVNKKFEIDFPKRFTLILKFLRILPNFLYLPIITKIYQKNLKH